MTRSSQAKTTPPRPRPRLASRGYASVVDEVPLEDVVLATIEWPPSFVVEAIDEDPFGHVALGIDDLGDLAVSTQCPVENFAEDVTEHRLAAGRSGQLGAHDSHQLKRTARVVWCQRCGRCAASLLGVGLSCPCKGNAEGTYLARIRRLQDGRRPISGDAI